MTRKKLKARDVAVLEVMLSAESTKEADKIRHLLSEDGDKVLQHLRSELSETEIDDWVLDAAIAIQDSLRETKRRQALRDSGKVDCTCVVCGRTELAYPQYERGYACTNCYKSVTTDESDVRHCVWPVPYTWCRRIDLNVKGLCPEHADAPCIMCGEDANDTCVTGTFAVCGAATCSDNCQKKHYRTHHPDGRLA